MNNLPPFVCVDEICKSIISQEKNENKSRNFPFNIEVFSPERSTECGRKILYDIYGGSNYETSITETQRQLKDKWISLFSRMQDVIVHGVDVEFSEIKYNLSGKVDMVLEFENRSFKSICNVTEASEELMSKIKIKGPLKKDITSLMIYMWMSEIPHSIIIYECKNNKEVEIFHIVPYNSIIRDILDKINLINNNKIYGRLIDRPYKNFDNNECKTCVYNKKCWEVK